jgi:hypothetical protein
LGEQLTSDAVDLRIGERLTSLKRAESALTESGHLRISRSKCPLVQGVAVRVRLVHFTIITLNCGEGGTRLIPERPRLRVDAAWD